MKLRLIFAGLVIALAACANTAQHGANATDANLLQGAEVAYTIGKGLYDAGKLSDEDAEAVVLAIQTVVAYVKASRAAGAAGNKASEAEYLRLAAGVLDQLTALLASRKV